MASLNVKIGGLSLKNPVLTASGTFGYGEEFSDFIDLGRIGGFITKGTTLNPREGNDYPRMAETASGMLNCVGLQNKGVDHFIEHIYPRIKAFNTNIIVNVSGSSPEDYAQCASKLAALEHVPAIELNISCPNVNAGFLAFGQDARNVETLTAQIKKLAKQPVIMKLTPNVTDITEIARAAEAGGADAVSLINTLTGMKIDIHKRTFALANKTGGVSGPAIHPVAVRMVYQTARAVKIPVIGMGGIATAEDAIEMILAGATAVAVGTANFADPQIAEKVVEGIEHYMEQYGIEDIHDLIGGVRE